MTTDAAAGGFDHRSFVRTLTTRPGVYRMLNPAREVLYVGKAKSLRRRVASYFRSQHTNARIGAMVQEIAAVEVTVTHTEAEALLLENHLIKELRPRYNVLLRDDKSYPYIRLEDGDFPRLAFYRGSRKVTGRLYGPYPSAGAVRETLDLLQKLFRVRQCEDSFFRNRSRPCLQYQIERCSAPCVALVDTTTYAEEVRNAELFLEGKSSELIDSLVTRMERASKGLEFERAARYRDQIVKLRRVQERQYVDAAAGDLDVVACALAAGIACVQVLFFRGGRTLGNKAFFPRMPVELKPAELLTAFLAQYYLEHPAPGEILVSHEPADRRVLEEALSAHARRRVTLSSRLRGDRSRWVAMAVTNAEQALVAQLSSRASLRMRFEALQDALSLEETPQRIECFDVSHTMGEATVASCVVFDQEGARKTDYRRYNIEGVTPGDDYAALQQALTRRYTRIQRGEGKVPDLLLIDGGAGQLARAAAVMEELQVDGVTLVGVAKGADRRPGMEELHLLGNGAPSILQADSPALHLIQQVRDEAHRFAITGHRQRRERRRGASRLEDIPGVGARRRQSLLRQFGGLQQLARAGVEDIACVPGISKALAQRIYEALHE
jgi:excinuclease ABC subunit C